MNGAAGFVRNALREEINRLLATCTDKQRELFDRIYPEGISTLSEDTLRRALELVQRTTSKNAATL
jgi:predicted type IV restriction endonuclease